MTRYIIRRLLGAVVVLFVVSVVTFLIFQWIPAASGTSPAYLYVGKVTNQAQIDAINHKLGFDQPLLKQYFTYMGGILFGRDLTDGTSTVHCSAPCFGYSFRYHQQVTGLIWSRLGVTISLAIGAAIIWLVMGVTVGIISALRKGSVFDRAAMTIAVGGISLPIYFTGLIALAIFSYGPSWIRILPNVHYVSISTSPGEWARNLILPWFVLAFATAALYARLTRANMLETMGEDYIRTARAKGLPERRVVVRHGLRAALTPIVTIFGIDVGVLLGGAILTETVFNFQGMGQLSYNAIQSLDFPVLMGVVITASVFIVVANIVVDILYGVVDPRVRLS